MLQTQNLEVIREWRKDIFLYCRDVLALRQSEPIDELVGREITYDDAYGEPRNIILFNQNKELVYHDLQFYTQEMFKNQSYKDFAQYNGSVLTWQQTVKLTAYNRAIATFGADSYEMADRYITTRSGHGTGKTSSSAIIAQHFLVCFFGANIGITANTDDQLHDIFLKEFSVWKRRMPEAVARNIVELDDFIRIDGAKDWFLRARVARPEKPEALAGLHSPYVLLILDEASGVHAKVFETMKGSLTGDNYVVLYDGNPTRAEGEFYESHKKGSSFTRLHFNSRHSPIVKPQYIQRMEDDYGVSSDEVRIRVDGDFPSTAEMDDQGWVPLFANVRMFFEPARGQVLTRCIIGCDPAGQGKDRSIVHVRDNVYLKEVLNEATSTEIDLARKLETIRDAYHSTTSDIGVDGFGIGAKVVANIRSRADENLASPMAILTDKAREEVKNKYHTYRSELAWLFREWVARGGIIITNNQKEWVRELEKIKYKRDKQGRIMIISKIEFKKEYGFSPDRFDAACFTFFKETATMPVHLTQEQLALRETQEWLQMNQNRNTQADYSSL